MPLDKIYITLVGAFSLICLLHYKKIYNPPALQNNPRLLVVDGFLTSAPDSTYITLTRSRNISDSNSSPIEPGATLIVEAENTAVMPLEEIRPGIYGGLFSLDSAQKYRLNIQTAGGVHYRSDFVPFRMTPEIDSLGWTEDSANVSIRVNTHDPANNTRYYRWAYEETCKYHTYFISYLMIPNVCGDCREHGGTSIKPGFRP